MALSWRTLHKYRGERAPASPPASEILRVRQLQRLLDSATRVAAWSIDFNRCAATNGRAVSAIRARLSVCDVVVGGQRSGCAHYRDGCDARAVLREKGTVGTT